MDDTKPYSSKIDETSEADQSFATLDQITQLILETTEEDYTANLEHTAEAARKASQAYLKKSKKFEQLALSLEKEHSRHIANTKASTEAQSVQTPTERKW